MTKFLGVAALVVMLSGCSSMEGQLGKKVEEFEDGHGRVCTTVKWGESASIDCDYPVVK